MNFQGEITEQDYVRAQWLHIKPRRKYRIAACALLGAFVVAYALAVIATASAGELGPLFGLLILVVLIVVLGGMVQWKYRRTYRKQPSLQGRHRYSFTDAGITAESPHARGEIDWSAFTKWREDSNLFLLYQAENLFHLLPKRWFDEDPSSIDEFRALLQKHSLRCIDGP